MATYNSAFVKGIMSDNPWWADDALNKIIFSELPTFTRSDYDYYISELYKNKVCVLLGPRRCGKSTLIKQIIRHLLFEKNANPKRILYVSLERAFYDLTDKKIRDILEFYQETILKKNIYELKEKIYLFIDEAHYDSSWPRIFKQFVELNLPIYAIISGSSAPALYKDEESGAGRFSRNQMVTLKFRDVARYLNREHDDKIKIISKELREALLESFQTKNPTTYVKKVQEVVSLNPWLENSMKAALQEYLLKGGYPEFYSGVKNKSWTEISRYYQTNVFDLILQKDVVAISNIRQPEKIRKLLVFLVQNTSRQLGREKITRHLGFKSQITVDQYIDALSEAFLIRTASRFKKGKGYPSTKAKKYYSADPGLRNSVLGLDLADLSTEEKGGLIETAVFNHSLRLLFNIDREIRQSGFYYEKSGEVVSERDIVLASSKLDSPIPLEVKNGSCGLEDEKKMRATISDLKSSFGIITCNDQIGLKNEKIVVIPSWVFLLSC